MPSMRSTSGGRRLLACSRKAILPLANFGQEHFTDVHISGHATRMIMVNRSGRAKATVTGSQRNFAVHFKHSK